MYQKILVPLDGSSEAERVIGHVEDELAPHGAFVLLQIIPPSKNQKLGEHVILSTQKEEADCGVALDYLKSVAQRQKFQPGEWLFEVTVSNSMAEEIINVALRQQADLIAMYTHGRRGLAKMLKGSIAQKVSEISSIEVRALPRHELDAIRS